MEFVEFVINGLSKTHFLRKFAFPLMGRAEGAIGDQSASQAK